MSEFPHVKDGNIIKFIPKKFDPDHKFFEDNVFVVFNKNQILSIVLNYKNSGIRYISYFSKDLYDIEVVGNTSFVKEGVKIKLIPTDKKRSIRDSLLGEFVVKHINGQLSIIDNFHRVESLSSLDKGYYPVEVKDETETQIPKSSKQRDTMTFNGKVYNLIPEEEMNTVTIQGKKYFLVEKEG